MSDCPVCDNPLRDDGSCRACEANRKPVSNAATQSDELPRKDAMSDTQERPVSQLVKFPATRMTLEQAKKEHDEWHPVYIEDCLWCRSEVALPSVRAALQASEERERQIRLGLEGADRLLDDVLEMPVGIPVGEKLAIRVMGIRRALRDTICLMAGKP